jgi:D-alanyl-D-alanine dipeptidase
MEEPQDLVYIDEYGLLGSNFYWHKFVNHGLTKEDILSAGVENDRVRVSKKIIDALVAVDAEIQEKGWRIFVKEGYRSKKLYEIVYMRRVQKYGQERTDALFNMASMPHARGCSVDIALWDKKENKEIFMRNGNDGDAALFIGFYKNKENKEAKKYQELQEYLISLMQKHGFQTGTKNEYFHFDYAQ